jgi:hypothetical protein
MYPSRGRGTENGGEMMALSNDGGPAFGAVNEALLGATALWRDAVGEPDALVRDGLAFLREGKRTRRALMKENRSFQRQG